MGRTLVIGDIHGCYDELCRLLEATGYQQGVDRLASVGDIFDRGPDPLGCLRLLQKLEAAVVLGNHCEKHIRWRRREQEKLATGKPNPMQPLPAGRLAVNAQITDDEMAWMQSWPTHLDLGQNTVMVHAGFMPGVPVNKQEDRHKLHLRWVDERLKYVSQYDEWSEPEGCKFWTQVWDGPCNVVYGHAAISLSRPRIDERPQGVTCWGVDTACVFGGHLSAFILEERRYVQVKSSGQWAEWKGPLEP